MEFLENSIIIKGPIESYSYTKKYDYDKSKNNIKWNSLTTIY